MILVVKKKLAIKKLTKQALLGLVLVLAAIYFLVFYKAEFYSYSSDGAIFGTSYNIKINSKNKLNKIEVKNLKNKIDEKLEILSKIFSTYDAESELSKLNQNHNLNTWLPISQPLAFLIEKSLYFNSFTNGAFDITVGPLVNLYGFGSNFNNYKKVPSPEVIANILATKIGSQAVKIIKGDNNEIKKTKDVYLDLSAIAKGYAVDLVSEILEANKLNSYLVEIGGEIRVRGCKKYIKDTDSCENYWQIAIERPSYNGDFKIYKVFNLKDQSLASSGDYRNYYLVDNKKYSHTINPKTGFAISNTLAEVSVWADTTYEADALATSFMVMGLEQAALFAKANKIKALFIYRKNNDLDVGEDFGFFEVNFD